MVRALLAGTKTQTRRPLRAGTWWTPKHGVIRMAPAGLACTGFAPVSCPYGQPGDRLWVRETFVQGWPHDDNDCPAQFDEDGNERPMTTWYRATTPDLEWCTDGENSERTPWRPSIHMPRAVSRITLEITGVRVEQLQAITRGDAMAEGCPFPNMAAGPDPRQWYADLWGQINGPGSWDANPWVWVVEFKRISA